MIKEIHNTLLNNIEVSFDVQQLLTLSHYKNDKLVKQWYSELVS